MPIYEYRCEECSNQFEIIVTSSSDKGETACPKCSSKKVKKAISAASYRLSGSGGSSVPMGSGLGGGCSSGSGFS